MVCRISLLTRIEKEFAKDLKTQLPKIKEVAIVVDSAASLNKDSSIQGIYVVPMVVSFGNKTFLDGQEMNSLEFYKKLAETEELPKTSAPSPQQFFETFQRASRNARSILCLTVGSSFSRSVESALIAADEASKDLTGTEIRVLDSGSASGGQALITLAAWRAAVSGLGLEEVVSVASAVINKVKILAFLDTLYYLWKGGRVPKFVHTGTAILGLKPIFSMERGVIRTVSRPRTRGRAIDRLVQLVREDCNDRRVHATVIHAASLNTAEELMMRLSNSLKCEELFVSEFTPVMGAHSGPGLVGVAYWTE